MVLEGEGHRVIDAATYRQGLSLVSNGLEPDLVVIETPGYRPPDASEFRELLMNTPAGAICLVTGLGEDELQREAAELGIKSILQKPLTRDDIEAVICRAVEPVVPQEGSAIEPLDAGPAAIGLGADQLAVPYLEELEDDRYFLAASPAMLKIYRQVLLLADVDAPVLILGESGTGKEIIAHLIHRHSRRSQHNFLNVNCAALPSDLLESELFGYRRGAFTGAIKDKPGKFEQVNRGTLLLDEIGEMSAQMQAKLLHVLQDGQFARLGARECSKVDVRVLAATNVQMESALEEKTFREDLYYRLSVFTISIPPLRDRREEIPYFIEETIHRAPAEIKNSCDYHFSSRLMDAALLYDWRGNVRELRNFVTRTIIMRDPEGAVRELETKIAASPEVLQPGLNPESEPHGSGMRSIMRDVKDRTESHLIRSALEASGWNRRHAAKYLNISYRALLYKIQQYRLAPRPSIPAVGASHTHFLARRDT
jgi:DNA-binding NtrC family response regulator